MYGVWASLRQYRGTEEARGDASEGHEVLGVWDGFPLIHYAHVAHGWACG